MRHQNVDERTQQNKYQQTHVGTPAASPSPLSANKLKPRKQPANNARDRRHLPLPKPATDPVLGSTKGTGYQLTVSSQAAELIRSQKDTHEDLAVNKHKLSVKRRIGIMMRLS